MKNLLMTALEAVVFTIALWVLLWEIPDDDAADN